MDLCSILKLVSEIECPTYQGLQLVTHDTAVQRAQFNESLGTVVCLDQARSCDGVLPSTPQDIC